MYRRSTAPRRTHSWSWTVSCALAPVMLAITCLFAVVLTLLHWRLVDIQELSSPSNMDRSYRIPPYAEAILTNWHHHYRFLTYKSGWPVTTETWKSPCRVTRGPMVLIRSTEEYVLIWETSRDCDIQSWVIDLHPLLPVNEGDDDIDGAHHLSEQGSTATDKLIPISLTPGESQISSKSNSISALITTDGYKQRRIKVVIPGGSAAVTQIQSAASLSIELKASGIDGPTVVSKFNLPCLPNFPKVQCTPIRIGCISDNQFGASTFYRITSALSRFQPHYVIHLGDAVQDAENEQQWQTDFFDIVRGSGLQNSAWIYVPGNHDMDPFWSIDVSLSYPNTWWKDRNESLATASSFGQHHFLLSVAKPTWRALTVGQVRFILLDSNHDTEEQDTWLKSELSSQECQSAIFRVVLCHIPAFMEFWDPVAWFKKDEKNWGAFIRERYVSLFEQHRVDMVMSGHQHNYERGERNGITYVIIGGSGGEVERDRVHDWEGLFQVVYNKYHYAILDIYPNILRWHVYDLQDRLLDEIELTAK